jgi:hypothetical protein
MALSLTGPTADETQNQGDWQGLDQEIQNLATSLQGESGVNISGFMRLRWDYSGDVTPTGVPVGATSLSGFTVENARLDITGEVGDYGFKIQPDFGAADISATGQILRDAKVWWNFGDNFKLTVGQYKVPFSRRYLTSFNKKAFLDPNMYQIQYTAAGPPIAGAVATPWSVRDQGVMVGGNMEMFDWNISLTNGTDTTAGRTDKYMLAARVDVHVMGGGAPNYEGGYGLGDESALTVGGAYIADSSLPMGESSWTLDGLWALNPFTVGASIVGQGSGYTTSGTSETAWDIYGTYMFTPNEWELALKYEDTDDFAATKAITVGVNWYLYGPDSKWQLNYKNLSRSSGFADGGVIEAGLVLSF